jgi:transposase
VHPALRQLAIILYAHFGVSMSGVARLCKVSVQAVVKWIRAASDAIQTSEIAHSEVVQVDEMWHFVNGKKTKFGSGERFAGYRAALSDGTSVIVLTEV